MNSRIQDELDVLQTQIQLNDVSKYKNAFHHLSQLSDKDARAKSLLGYLYLRGKGTPQDIQRAMDLFLSSEKIPSSKTFIGIMYEEGLFFEKDVKKAAKYYVKAARSSDPFALTRIGHFYETGTFYAQDLKKALSYYEIAAHMGHIEAMVKLAHLYSEFDLNKGLEITEKLMEMGSSDGYYCLAKLRAFYYDSSEDPDQSKINQILEMYKVASRMGNPFADFMLGTLYSDERMIPRDMENAVKYFQKSSDGGNTDALISLGEIFEHDGRVEEALQLWIQAYEQKNPKSYNIIGDYLYKQGKIEDAKKLYKMGLKHKYLESYTSLARVYLQQDCQDKAIKLLKDSIHLEPNFVDASFMLAQIYQDQDDQDQAIEWYNHGALLDHVPSVMALASIYENIDIHQTIAYLEKAVELGDDDAILELATIFEEGHGIDADPHKAVKYHKMGYEKGLKISAFKLGYFYENGIGVKQDYKEALKYYLESNEPIAKNNLGELYLKGHGVKHNTKRAQEYFEQAIEMGEDSGWALQNLCILLMLHGGAPGTKQSMKLSKRLWIIIEENLKENPNDPDTMFVMARCYLFGLGVDIDYPQAKELLESIIDEVPEAQKYLEEYF